MKITEPIQHDDKVYAYGDDVSDAEAKKLPDGYAVSDTKFKELEKVRESDPQPVEFSGTSMVVENNNDDDDGA